MKEEDLIQDTLELMRLIDRTEEFGDCLLWKGSKSRSGHPTYKPIDGICSLVRRDVYKMAKGRIRKNPIDCTCGEKACINPDHLFQSTTKQIGQKAAKAGAWRTMTRAAKIAKTKREKHGKLNMELAREIRLSDETGPVLAERHGVHRSVITGIKTGKRWKEYSSPFAGLLPDQWRKRA